MPALEACRYVKPLKEAHAISYTIRPLSAADLTPDFLAHFERHQQIEHCWRRQGGGWVLKPNPYLSRWRAEVKQQVLAATRGYLAGGGQGFAACTEDGTLAAFATLAGGLFGSCRQYMQLAQLYASRPHRGRGLGRTLFNTCAEAARGAGAQKLYISSHPAQQTIAFYFAMGCADALEPDPTLIQKEPLDRQLDFSLFP